MLYVVYIYDGITADRRFEFRDYGPALSCFKRFVRAKQRVAMFYHKEVSTTRRDSQNRYKTTVRNVSELIYKTDDFPYARDRKDITTHDRMGAPPVRERHDV